MKSAIAELLELLPLVEADAVDDSLESWFPDVQNRMAKLAGLLRRLRDGA